LLIPQKKTRPGVVLKELLRHIRSFSERNLRREVFEGYLKEEKKTNLVRPKGRGAKKGSEGKIEMA